MLHRLSITEEFVLVLAMGELMRSGVECVLRLRLLLEQLVTIVVLASSTRSLRRSKSLLPKSA